ncbi:g9845 [Coccomyxa viridis]|uniref:G9845 protein n=1 Tax=Coccomyxa viridis TaxID=1274662 RepID=A0ABP1G6G3_9CHLO
MMIEKLILSRTILDGRGCLASRARSAVSAPHRLSTPITCSIPPSAFQAAERRASSKSCSTSSSGSDASQPASLAARESQEEAQEPVLWECQRRGLLLGAAALLGLGLNTTAKASKLPPAVDRAWEKIGGGPADLYFPEEFLGVWNVESTLTSIKLPLGTDYVPDLKVVKRAEDEDLNKDVRYHVAFIRNPQGRVITDRRYNTLSLLDYYLGHGRMQKDDINWNYSDPNVLTMTLPGGLDVTTRVTRRSENDSPPDRLDTSEYFQQTYVAPGRLEPRIKASQCFTKYKWRDLDAAKRQSGPQIVATQVVSDYLTPYDGEMRMMRSNNQPVVVYSYRMRFWRDPSNTPSSA